MTIKEFARLAGVSVSTVSKIMNGKDASISARTREHVLKLAKEYNYVPYASATTPMTKTLTMGVIFQNSRHGSRLIPSILKEATAMGYSILLRDSGNSADTELKNISAMVAAHTDGVIWEPVSDSSLFLGEQLDAVFTDIYPDAVKIGMVSSSDLIRMIASKLQEYKAANIVVDPVMVATSGAKLISDDAIETLKKELLPLATVITPLAQIITPNIPEAEVLADMKIANEEEMIIAAEKISKKFGCAILVKGGHQINDANDLLYRDDAYTWFHGKRINNSNTHGTGCTLSSAIASNLAKGYDLDTSVKRAKDYISGALNAMLDLGKGSGPMDHSFAIDNEYAKENVQ